MHALVVTNMFPPHALGGYERACADVVHRWTASGHRVAVLTSTYRVPGADDGTEAGIERSLPTTSLYAPPLPMHRRPAVERAARRTLDEAIDRVRPEIAVVWNVAGLPLSTIMRLHERHVPTMFVVADAWPVRTPIADPWVSPFQGTAPRRLAGRLAAIAGRVPTVVPPWDALGRWAFCSEALRRQIAEATGARFTDSAIVPLGVDTDDFPLDAAFGDDRAAHWNWKLLFVGRLDPAKGIDTLLRAVAQMPADASLEICGPDEPMHVERVRQLASDLGISARVHIGAVARDELAARYRNADACVFPSEWQEPFGIVPLEAMACSTPVVASATGGSAEYLHDGANCVVAAPGDPKAIVTALLGLAGDPALRERVIEGGLATAASLTVDHLADRLEQLATTLLREQG